MDDDMMKSVFGIPSFSLLDSLRSPDRLMTFEEILVSTVDEDKKYM